VVIDYELLDLLANIRRKPGQHPALFLGGQIGNIAPKLDESSFHALAGFFPLADLVR
jgi:hypothetical protein